MKTNNLTKILILSVVGFSACKLDETVYSSVYTENFYKLASDMEAAIAAAYSPMTNLYGGPAALLASDFSADQTFPRVAVSRNTLTLFTYDVNYTAQRTAGREYESPQRIWTGCYSGIEKANWVIEKVPGASMDAGRKKEIIGEAFFLRAFYHWMAAKNFGDVPIKTKASDVEKNAFADKSKKADVYKQIYRDLDSAVNKLPTHTARLVKGRASKEAALALYAKAALYNEDWARALSNAQATLANSYLKMMREVKDLYDVTKEDEARKENIFAFEAEAPSSVVGSTAFYGHQMTGLCGPPNNDAPDSYGRVSFGSMFAYQKFFDSFNPIDKRRQLLDTTYTRANGQTVKQRHITPITAKGVLVKKYQDAISVGGSSNNLPILRLADVYLIAAEAEARLNGATELAYGYIRAVRERAGLPDLAMASPGLTKEQFIEAVIQERSWEFFAEGDRWYDLTRTDKFLTVIPQATNDVYPIRKPLPRNKYFPIPQDELNANPAMQQNDPWK